MSLEGSATGRTGSPGAAVAGGNRRLDVALLVIGTAQLMVVLDATIVNVALPYIQRALGFSGAGLEWVVNAYALSFGGLLLIQQLFPEARALGSLLFVAIGLAFLVKWAIDRGSGSLYAGAIITALAAPGLIEEAMNATYDGLGTLCLGIAFLFIAVVRAATSGGIGWQAWLGGALAIIGVA